MDEVIENWRPVRQADPGYEVSDLGRVRAVRERVTRILTQRIERNYPVVSLRVNKKSKDFRVHQLVLYNFVPPPEGEYFVCHYDDDKQNNNLSNLYWGTRSENARDAIRNGKAKIGEERTQAVLTEDQVREIHARRKSGEKLRDIAESYGVDRSLVGKILKGVKWPHVYAALYPQAQELE